jgi:hypothetical protein
MAAATAKLSDRPKTVQPLVIWLRTAPSIFYAARRK